MSYLLSPSVFKRTKSFTGIALTLLMVFQALGPGVFALNIANAQNVPPPKIEICHQTGETWMYMETPAGESLDGHLGHGDFLYEGGDDLDKNEKDIWCEENAPEEPTEVSSTEVPSIDLTKTAEFDGNHKVTYTIEWSVSGADVDSLTITDTLPPYTDLVVGSVSPSTTNPSPLSPGDGNFDPNNPNDNRVFVWDLGEQDEDASGEITFDVELWVNETCEIETNYAHALATYDQNEVEAEAYSETVETGGEQCDPTPPQCVPDLELIKNGSFEDPEVTDGAGWDVFDSGTLSLEWVANWMRTGGSEPATASLELHGGVNGWLPSAGSQYAELDGDWQGPGGGNGEDASTYIYQDIPTVPGETYKLSFDFSPRPNTSAPNNVLGVVWDGGDVGGTPVSSGNVTNQTDWTNYIFDLVATSNTTRLQFEDRGTGDSLGTFLDNVSLKCEEPEKCEETSGSVVSDETVVVTYVDVDGATSTPNTNAEEVSVVPQIQSLGANVWDANVGDVNAKWIWSEDPYDADWEVNKWVTFTKTFTVDGEAQSSSLKIAADNEYEVWVNGVLINSDFSEDNHSVADGAFDVTDELQDGNNTIEVRVKNIALPGSPQENNPGGLLFALSWTAKDCDPDDGGGDPEKDQYTVTFHKFIDGEEATQGEFEIEWGYSNLNAQGSGYLLDLNDGNDYTASTELIDEMSSVTWEETGSEGMVVSREQCEIGKYYLAGYIIYEHGQSPVGDPDTINSIGSLSHNMHVNVYNETCPTPPDCVEGPTWAATAPESDQGTKKGGAAVNASRSNPDNALGTPDGDGNAGTGFFSLGVEGWIVVKFDHYVENVDGDDLSFHEITNGRSSYPEETAEVEVSQDGSNWQPIGTISSKATNGIDYLDFDSTGWDWIQYVRITDTTNFGPHSNDADGYDLDAVDATNGLCEQPEEEPLLATVTMCKLDAGSQDAPLSGWQLLLLGTQVEADLSVNSTSQTGSDTTASLVAGASYVARAEGTWSNQNGANLVDAEYSTTDGWSSFMDGYTGYPTEILELQLAANPLFGDWGAYNDSHVYWQGFSPSVDGSYNFRIFDGDANTNTQNAGWFGDNSGSLTVDVYEGFTGVTGDNGCVVFNDVPFGEYDADEVLQDGWELVDGTGSVVVDEEEETFNIRNTRDSGDNGGGGGDTFDPYIVKVVDDSTPEQEQKITYTLTVYNNSNAEITNLVVEDTLPVQVTYVSDTGGADTSVVGNTITWTIASIPANGNVSIDVEATVNQGVSGNIPNTATITDTGDQGNSDTNNDSDSATITVNINGGGGSSSRSGGFVAGASSGSSSPGEVLGAAIDLPGLPNTGNGEESQTATTIFALVISLALLNLIGIRAFGKQGRI